jgi:hypothetical protein
MTEITDKEFDEYIKRADAILQDIRSVGIDFHQYRGHEREIERVFKLDFPYSNTHIHNELLKEKYPIGATFRYKASGEKLVVEGYEEYGPNTDPRLEVIIWIKFIYVSLNETYNNYQGFGILKFPSYKKIQVLERVYE